MSTVLINSTDGSSAGENHESSGSTPGCHARLDELKWLCQLADTGRASLPDSERAERDGRLDAEFAASERRAPEELSNTTFDVDQVWPRSQGGIDSFGSFALSREAWNRYKGDAIDTLDPRSCERVRLFSLRANFWFNRFRVGDDNDLIGLMETLTGK